MTARTPDSSSTEAAGLRWFVLDNSTEIVASSQKNMVFEMQQFRVRVS